MRPRCLSVLAVFLSVLVAPVGADRAAAYTPGCRPPLAAEPQLVLKAIFSCGMIDGKFQCQAAPGGAPLGKNANPGAPIEPHKDSPEAAPGGTWQGTTTGTDTGQVPADAATSCQGGMVGTPPNCQCPESSELLGGNCVHYTATCKNGLAAEAPPQQCQGAEEKLACTARADGFKDCCCITYDKF